MPSRASTLALAGILALFTVPAAPSLRAQGGTTAAAVTVQANTPLSAIPTSAFGVNTAAWDGFLLDAAVPGLLRQASVATLRFPGGSVTDVYHWQTNTASQGQYVNPKNTFDAFMGVVQQTGAQALLCVNYGTNPAGNAGGDPNEAAAWVDYANNAKHYGVKYWEVGNEVYGNGEYGASFETDLHADHSPTAYGKGVAAYAAAMKAKDPTIEVGAVLTAPGHFPDGQPPDWNTNVLAQCGGVIDFVIVHWYPQEPGSESDSFLLGAPAQISGMVAKLRALIGQYGGANAPNIQILVTETNSVTYNPGKQTVSLVNALFLADDYATWLEQGVANVDAWTLHNGVMTGDNNNAGLYGGANYGDYGILSSGQSPEPAADSPFPAYFSLQMLGYLGRPGDQFVSVSSSQPLLAAHAVRQAGGGLALLLINKDPANSCAASISVAGYTPAAGSNDYVYNETTAGGIAATPGAAGASFTRTLPPYSLTTIVMQPAGGSPPPTPTPTPAPPPPPPTPPPTPSPTATPTPTPAPTPTVAAPAISSATVATGRQGIAFTYQTTASNNPAAYAAAGLPAGLTIDRGTGLIAGTPTQAGAFAVTLAATNAGGTGAAALTLTIAPAPPTVTLTADAPRAYPAEGLAGSFVLTRAGGDLSRPLKVIISVRGSAEPGTDYQLLSLTRKIKANKTSAEIVINASDLTGGNPNAGSALPKKTVKLSVQPASAYEVGTPSTATVKIFYHR